jgi:hypothetical protein
VNSSLGTIPSDFEPISARSAKLRGIKSLSLSHQSSFLSEDTPRPSKIDRIAEWLLKNYAPCEFNIGFHFKDYDDFILPPHIRSVIRNSKENTTKQDYILVYLSAYNPYDLVKAFSKYTDYKFIIISPEIKDTVSPTSNTTIKPADPIKFMDLLINCSGVITGGGFETVAEALYLNKRVLTIPIKGQYEQECNAEAANRIHNGYKGMLAPVYLRWFLERTKLLDADFDFKISKTQFTFEKQSSSNNCIVDEQINTLCKMISNIKVSMKDLITMVFNKFINTSEKFQKDLETIIHFITLIDLLYTKAGIAKKYNYCNKTKKDNYSINKVNLIN